MSQDLGRFEGGVKPDTPPKVTINQDATQPPNRHANAFFWDTDEAQTMKGEPFKEWIEQHPIGHGTNN